MKVIIKLFILAIFVNLAVILLLFPQLTPSWLLVDNPTSPIPVTLKLTAENIVAVLSLSTAVVALIPPVVSLYYQAVDRVTAGQVRDCLFDAETISDSTKYFVRPTCSSVDPSYEAEIRHLLTATSDLFSQIDDFLSGPADKKYLFVLADSGMGKTSFAINYYLYNRRKCRKHRRNMLLLPLGISEADAHIHALNDQAGKVLILDAFDEDTKAAADYHGRITELMNRCRNYDRVIITCRTQFFPRDEEIPCETGIVKLGPKKAGERGTYVFWKLYISPFSNAAIDAYLRKRYSVLSRKKRVAAYQLAMQMPLLAVRPMLLAHIPDIVDNEMPVGSCHELYHVMIEAWLVRESAYVDPDELREFSERLAVDLYCKKDVRSMERVPRDELLNLAKEWDVKIDRLHISSRSLLNRDAMGNFKFAHRSFMEYLFVKEMLAGNTNCYGSVLTDMMKEFMIEMLGLKEVAEKGTLSFISSAKLTFDDTLNYNNPSCSIIDNQTVRSYLRNLMEVSDPQYQLTMEEAKHKMLLAYNYDAVNVDQVLKLTELVDLLSLYLQLDPISQSVHNDSLRIRLTFESLYNGHCNEKFADAVGVLISLLGVRDFGRYKQKQAVELTLLRRDYYALLLLTAMSRHYGFGYVKASYDLFRHGINLVPHPYKDDVYAVAHS